MHPILLLSVVVVAASGIGAESARAVTFSRQFSQFGFPGSGSGQFLAPFQAWAPRQADRYVVGLRSRPFLTRCARFLGGTRVTMIAATA